MDIYVDGASAGNPGISGAGIILVGENLYEQHAYPLSVMSNHEAEFIAIKLGLELAVTKQAHFVRLYSDSKVAIEALEKRYVKNPLFKPHLTEILNLTEKIPLFYPAWRHVTQNKQADQLAKQAIQKQKELGDQ
ncbi:ribonuclease HI family protein [Listeria sp. PSOL-1]|uniref:ribonuclease HI family protein n=1 Tax=Listeria sp. PSOL-1 TaxID=1844999 RepID=UPI0013D3A351|nr:ribonuclease HI family protein [Listeria sp. PSOL-1]